MKVNRPLLGWELELRRDCFEEVGEGLLTLEIVGNVDKVVGNSNRVVGDGGGSGGGERRGNGGSKSTR